MIELSRLNGRSIIVNAELIKFVEDSPDTVITLVTGDKLVVREPVSEVMRKTLDYRRSLLRREAEHYSSELQSPAECSNPENGSGE
jgi:flagellar protein FlbD